MARGHQLIVKLSPRSGADLERYPTIEIKKEQGHWSFALLKMELPVSTARGHDRWKILRIVLQLEEYFVSLDMYILDEK